MSVRDELLNQRLRYVDDHGSVNYVELVLTANTFNDLMNRMIGAQQVAASDRRLIDEIGAERSQFIQTNAELGIQRQQVEALLKQLESVKADLEKNKAAQKAALTHQTQRENQLNDTYRQLEAQRKAIAAHVPALQLRNHAAPPRHAGRTLPHPP